jgi:hypothetical protein
MYKCPKETKTKIKVHWSNIVQRYLRGVDLRGAQSRVSMVTSTGATESIKNLHVALAYVYKCGGGLI